MRRKFIRKINASTFNFINDTVYYSKKETADELPLNGKLIKLNDFQNILHFRDLPEMELGAYFDKITNYSMNIGIDFNSPISKTSSLTTHK